jgi:cytochrome c oxidase subunit II
VEGSSHVPDSFAVVTPQGSAIASLFWVALALSALVFALVVGVLVVTLVRDRGRPGDPDPEQVHGNRTLEIAWTVAPALLLLVMFVLTVRTMQTVNAEPSSPLRVQVIGHQWWWEYRYPDLGIVTANELILPTGAPVRLELTSADVIHSFWVPQIGWKKDVIPNQANTMNVQVDHAGSYDGPCTEYCGTQHAWMRIRLVAQSPAAFDGWTKAQQQPAPAPTDPSVQRGAQLFASSSCVNCHAIAGTSAVAHVGPDLSHVGSRTIIGAGVLDNSPDSLGRWIRDPQAVKPGVLMPAYPNFSDADLAALASYLSGLK